MEKGNAIDEINDLMVKQFVMKGDKIRLLVTTVSSVIKTFDQSVIEVKQTGREEFWKLCKEEMDLFIHMAPEGGFSLSLVEPMMLGVPAIIGREPWSEGVFGKTYPFFVKNETEAYAFVQMFYEDYPAMYAKWADGSQLLPAADGSALRRPTCSTTCSTATSTPSPAPARSSPASIPARGTTPSWPTFSTMSGTPASS